MMQFTMIAVKRRSLNFYGCNKDEDEDEVNVPTVSYVQACKSFETILVYLDSNLVYP